MDNGDAQLPKSFEALAKVVLATRQDVARHEHALFGDERSNGVVAVCKEARGAVRDLQEQYLTDRDAAINFYRETVEPEMRELRLGMRRMFAVACIALVVATGLAATVLVMMGDDEPRGTLVADGR